MKHYSYLDTLGMFMCMILRHNPEEINITLDEHGWANVDELIEGISNAGYKINIDILEKIVKEDNKQRYSFNEDHSLIRANQGHTIPVDVELYELTKDDIDKLDVLYHGTSTRFVSSIDQNGILRMQRNYVQLSTNIETAKSVGNRHNRKYPGNVCIYVIDIKSMFNDGIKIFRSVNNVYLTHHVPTKYFIDKIIIEE